MPWVQQLAMRAFIAGHTALYRLTSGRIGGKVVGLPVLLLTTTGRKSGLRRTVPLVFFEDGERLVVIASKGGDPRDPIWWLNLQKNPEAEVQVGAEHRRMRARLASPDARARLWPRAKHENPRYAEYEKRTAREIPVVLLCT